MGSLHAILGPSRTTASSRLGGSDRQVLEERASLFSYALKDDSLFSTPFLLLLLLLLYYYYYHHHHPLGWITTRSVPLPLTLLALHTVDFSAAMAKRKATAKEPLAQAESNGYKRGLTERKTVLDTERDI
jgi:hypothetical protein